MRTVCVALPMPRQRLLAYSLLRGFFKVDDIRYIDKCLPITQKG